MRQLAVFVVLAASVLLAAAASAGEYNYIHPKWDGKYANDPNYRVTALNEAPEKVRRIVYLHDMSDQKQVWKRWVVFTADKAGRSVSTPLGGDWKMIKTEAGSNSVGFVLYYVKGTKWVAQDPVEVPKTIPVDLDTIKEPTAHERPTWR